MLHDDFDHADRLCRYPPRTRCGGSFAVSSKTVRPLSWRSRSPAAGESRGVSGLGRGKAAGRARKGIPGVGNP